MSYFATEREAWRFVDELLFDRADLIPVYELEVEQRVAGETWESVPKEVQRHTTLYRLRDRRGFLLYVGIAGNPGRRFEQHAHHKPWWSQVISIELEHFDDRDTAVEAERRAIRSEHPRHNIAHARADVGSLLTDEQVTEVLQLSKRTVERLIASGDLPSVVVGRARRVRRSDLELYVENLAAMLPDSAPR